MVELPENIFVKIETTSGEREFEISFSPEADMPEDTSLDNFPSQNYRLVEDTVAFFEPNGKLDTAAQLNGRKSEIRPQQLAMAQAIANALSSGRNLTVEAPTGVGKSFAYLIPLVYRSRDAALPALISTETINLQEQLIEKDIPLLQELTGIDFKACLAKGRSNYLCKRRLSYLAGEQAAMLLPQPSLKLNVEQMVEAVEDSENGERDSFDYKVIADIWSLIHSDGSSCQGVKCPFFRNCFYFKARREWENADIIVANHALFFTDLAMRSGDSSSGALLPNYGALVIDEAHTLEDNAAEHLGIHISKAGLNNMLNRLFNTENGRGLLLRNGADALVLRQMIAAIKDDVKTFFKQFEDIMHSNSGKTEAFESNTKRILDSSKFVDNISDTLMVFHRKLKIYLGDIEDKEESLKSELGSQLDRCRVYIDGIKSFISMSMQDAVYYLEYNRGSIELNVSPLNVADLLYELIFNQDYPVILSSATLTVRDNFNFFCERVGFDNGDTLLLDSPFSREQAQVLIAQNMVEPNDIQYNNRLCEEIPHYIERTNGKAFVLFTSYSTMRFCAEKLRSFFVKRGIRLLIQGEDMTRSAMLREFKEDIDSVIFGTDSFWTGVDVPGEALSSVIITKLPFPSPGMPLVEARCEKLESSGKSSFRDYTLPCALLKLRQGIGRLIRSKSDKGVIVLLDKRVISKGYGRSFISSIPYNIVTE